MQNKEKIFLKDITQIIVKYSGQADRQAGAQMSCSFGSHRSKDSRVGGVGGRKREGLLVGRNLWQNVQLLRQGKQGLAPAVGPKLHIELNNEQFEDSLSWLILSTHSALSSECIHFFFLSGRDRCGSCISLAKRMGSWIQAAGISFLHKVLGLPLELWRNKGLRDPEVTP